MSRVVTPYDRLRGIDSEAELRLPPHIILPGQWASWHRTLSQEQRLWLAVLEDAIELATRPDDGTARTARLRDTAREWIASWERAPGSFGWVCDIAGLESGLVRCAVLETDLYIKFAREKRRGG